VTLIGIKVGIDTSTAGRTEAKAEIKVKTEVKVKT
jgi:hypothetical protein